MSGLAPLVLEHPAQQASLESFHAVVRAVVDGFAVEGRREVRVEDQCVVHVAYCAGMCYPEVRDPLQFPDPLREVLARFEQVLPGHLSKSESEALRGLSTFSAVSGLLLSRNH